VRKVSVRRKFPWSLEVQLEEHKALARWNGNGLVNTYGEVFTEKTDLVLPAFFGQPNTSAQMAGMYDELSKELRADEGGSDSDQPVAAFCVATEIKQRHGAGVGARADAATIGAVC
jgi:hypothetical protein